MNKVKMCELDKTINTILAKDKMKPCHRDILKNHSDSSKEEIKLVQSQTKKIVVKSCEKHMKTQMKKAKIVYFAKIVTVIISQCTIE